MNITTELERKLIGAIGGFMGITAKDPAIAESILRAAELSKDEVEDAMKGDANDRFNCTMWNVCNAAIGAPMLTHAEIREKRNG